MGKNLFSIILTLHVLIVGLKFDEYCQMEERTGNETLIASRNNKGGEKTTCLGLSYNARLAFFN